MESRRKPHAANPTHNIDPSVDAQGPAVAPGDFPNLARLIARGQITLGVIRPMAAWLWPTTDTTLGPCCTDVVAKTLLQLLTRLEFAVDKTSLKKFSPMRSARLPKHPSLR
jgi:hypothetical protein